MTVEKNISALLYRVRKREVASLGGKTTSTDVTPSRDVFSSKRKNSSNKSIRIGAQACVIDMFREGRLSMYPAADGTSWFIDSVSTGGIQLQFLVNDAAIRMEQEGEDGNIPAVVSCVPPFVAQMIVSGNEELRERLETAIDGDEDDVLGFVDEVYFGRTGDQIEFELGSNILPEVQAAFENGLFSPDTKYGTLESAMEQYAMVEEDITDDETAIAEDVDMVDFASMSDKEIEKAAMDGKFAIENEWNDEVKGFVRPLETLKGVKWTKEIIDLLCSIYWNIKQGLPLNGLVFGKAGTGKSYALATVATALQIPYAGVSVSENTEEDTFGFINRVVHGKLEEIKSIALKFHEFGGLLVLEEVNLAKPAVIQGVFSQRLCAPFIADVNGEYIPRHEKCVVFGTMNVGTAGTKDLNEALSSRLAFKVELADPTKADFINRLCKFKGDKKFASWVYDMYTRILDALVSPEFNGEDYVANVTFRGCAEIMDARRIGRFSPKELINNMLVNCIREKDPVMGDRIWAEVIEPAPDFVK